MRATIGRQTKPSNGLPYTRIMAAFMLATLISALFALPAYAAGHADVAHRRPGPASAAAASSVAYTITVTNNGQPTPALVVVFTDTIDVGTGDSRHPYAWSPPV